MSHARLTKLLLKNFKSYGADVVEVDFHPLTLLVGRNNSGKSSIIQALLLLKQTLEQVRGNEPLTLHGSVPVPAGDLSEITHWPTAEGVEGPTIAVEWTSTVDVREALESAGNPELGELAKNSGIDWVKSSPNFVDVRTRLTVSFAARDKRIVATLTELHSWRIEADSSTENPKLSLRLRGDGSYEVLWQNDPGLRKLEVEWDHFLPLVSVDRRKVGPRHSDRGRANGFLLIYDQPLADLKYLLGRLAYLSSARLTPQPIYQPVGGEVSDVGISGERAAQILHSRGRDAFHYLSPMELRDDGVIQDERVRQKPLVDSIGEIFDFLGIPSRFSTEEITNIGFVLHFGKASLFHVGRGISYLLPIVELGLLGDPLANRDLYGSTSLDEYLRQIREVSHIAVEEPESHLHPAVHARLAHFFASTAMCGRQWLIETHSDHLVRRLRRLAAAAGANSSIERWLCSNVAVLEVTQQDGVSQVRKTLLTPSGDGSERWPEEFMDRALDEEDAIYLRRIAKVPVPTIYEGVEIEHRPADEDNEE